METMVNGATTMVVEKGFRVTPVQVGIAVAGIVVAGGAAYYMGQRTSKKHKEALEKAEALLKEREAELSKLKGETNTEESEKEGGE